MNEINSTTGTANPRQNLDDGDDDITNAVAGAFEMPITKSISLYDTSTDSTSLDQNSSTVCLTVCGIKYHQENVQFLDSIMLHREPDYRFGV
mmetsp:Transcript_32851/g.68933  ORF Transcript_32851/g.68933 Transcript_32851/m.68933 type:complete len:92 (-) Transcript_32851:1199-1474(-)